MDRPYTPEELAERVDAVDYDVYRPWNSSDEPALEFTFQFEASPAVDFPWSDVSGFFDWTDVKQQTIRTALDEFSKFINVDFVEQTGAVDPDFSFYLAVNGLSGGRGRFDYAGTDWDGSAVFNNNRSLDSNDLWIVLHEIGHTLGLKHTGEYDVGGNLPPGPFLPADEDNGRNTVMSYNEVDPVYGVIDSLGVLDIKALQDRFGANMSHNAGKTTYTGPEDGSFYTIWDGGGRDVFSARDAGGPVSFDLRAGMLSDFWSAGVLVIAYGTEIENAVGSDWDDDLTGNNLNNRLNGKDGNDIVNGGRGNDKLFGQGGNDTLIGGNGRDRIKDGAGDDVIKAGNGKDRIIDGSGDDRVNGGKGFDVFVVNGKEADYELTEIRNNVWDISDGRETDRLISIEQIIFTDDVFMI